MKEFKLALYEQTGLENIVEDIVINELYKLYQRDDIKSNFCTCWICLADVAAIMLNELAPSYYSNFIDKEKKAAEYKKNKAHLQLKILDAFEKVKKNPHH